MNASRETLCVVDGCDRNDRLTKGMCQAHYRRWQRGSDLSKPLRTYAPGGSCSVDDCERVVQSRGMCKMHAKRDRVHGDPSIVKPGYRPGRGEQHYNWLGDAVTYVGAHFRVVRSRGSATTHVCAFCNKPADDWAYDHTDPNPLTGYVRGFYLQYSGDPKYYIPLCTLCHKQFDKSWRLGLPFGERTLCIVDDCDRSDRLTKGMCKAHYMRFLRGANLTKPLRKRGFRD